MEAKQVAAVENLDNVLRHVVSGYLVVERKDGVCVDVGVGELVYVGDHRSKNIGYVSVWPSCLSGGGAT